MRVGNSGQDLFLRRRPGSQLDGLGDDSGRLQLDRRERFTVAHGQEHRTVAATGGTLPLFRDDPATSQDEGRTFAFVSGMGGRSVRNQERCFPPEPPYGCPEWASIYTSDQGATFGAMFGVFNYEGDPARARFYFKDVQGNVADDFFVTIGTGDLRQVTNLQTGITGITASSPALSVAQRTDRITFSVYEGGQHRVYGTTRPDVLAGVEPRELPGVSAALLPPATRKDGGLIALIQNPVPGLPPKTPADVEPYKAALHLDAVGQPSFGIGMDRFGSYASGGVAFQFSDMLGDHQLGAAVDLTTSISGDTSYKDIGASIFYMNMKNRWNWGTYLEQIPYRTGGFAAGFVDVQGQPAYVEQSILFRQTILSVGALTAYPFSRAQRVEFRSAFRNLSFDQETQTVAFSTVTGEVILDDHTSEQVVAPYRIENGALEGPLRRDRSIPGGAACSGGGQNRTADTGIMRPLLYQLSYAAGSASCRWVATSPGVVDRGEPRAQSRASSGATER